MAEWFEQELFWELEDFEGLCADILSVLALSVVVLKLVVRTAGGKVESP
jgi:hypothetical protein